MGCCNKEKRIFPNAQYRWLPQLSRSRQALALLPCKVKQLLNQGALGRNPKVQISLIARSAPAQKQFIQIRHRHRAPGGAAVVALVAALGLFHLAQQRVHFIEV